jgi:hypothetical protein
VSLGVTPWTATESLLRELEERIRADFQPVLPELTLRFIPYSEWVANTPDVEASGNEIVCVTDRSAFPIQVAEGVETSCYVVADQLQDIVMDDLQKPWPVLHADGAELIPTPTIDVLGKACWQVEGRFLCPIGYLYRALAAFGIIE